MFSMIGEMNMSLTLRIPLAFAIFVTFAGGSLPTEINATEGPAQFSYQKGYDAKQKSSTPSCEHRHHLCLPPPNAPLLQSVAVLRVPPPRREISVRVRQESGNAESGAEDEQLEIDKLKLRMRELEQRFDKLFQSVDRLVDRLQAPSDG